MRRVLLIAIAMLPFCGMCAQTEDYVALLNRMNEAKSLADAKQYVAAGDAYRAVSMMVKDCRTETDRQTYVMSSIKASSNYYMSNDSCEVGYEIAKSLLQNRLTDDERQLAERYYSLNGTLLSMKCIKKDRKQYEKGRAIAEEVLPYATPKVKTKLLKNKATAWYLEAYDYFFAGEYDKSYSCFENAGKEYDNIGEADDYVNCLKQMALCRYWQYKYQEALGLYEQAYTYSEQHGLTAQQIEILTEKKKIYKDLDDREKIAEIVAETSRLLKANEQLDVTTYTLLGDDAASLADHYIAETYYLKAIEFAKQDEKARKDASIPVLYGKLRDAMRAAKEYVKAIAYENLRIETAKERVSTLGSLGEYYFLADIYADMGDKENALIYIEKYLNSVEGKSAEELAEAYLMSGLIKGNLKEYDAAIADINTAVQNYGKDSPSRMRAIALRSGLQGQCKLYEESKQGYEQYYQWVKSVYGDESTETCNALYYLANIEALNGNIEKGEQFYIESTNKFLQLIKNNMRSVSSSERESYWQSISESLWQMSAFGIKEEATNSVFTETSYNALLFSKSLLLASEQSMYEVLQKKGSAEDLSDYAALAALQAQINALGRDYAANKEQIGALHAEKLRIDRKLTEKCKAYGDYTSFLDIKYDDIKNALGEGDVVLDFTDYVRDNGEHVYAAYIIRRGDEHPLLRKVFNEEQVDSLLQEQAKFRLYSEDLSAKAIDIFWEPLQEYVSEGSTVYLVPSGIVHQVAIESLPLSDETLLGDKYDFIRLSSAREILRKTNEINISDKTDATLFGGILYEVSNEEMEAESSKYSISPLLATRGANRDIVNREPFSYLPNSKAEVDEVAAILKEKNVNVTTLTGSEGTEESFLSMNGNAPELLLISTHGFYYTKEKAAQVDYFSGYSDAMSLSGLIMAGANRAWRGEPLPDGVQSGILTASKISRLDLEGNEIVVLSACQTAQGETTAEGVYGLQRAFKKAGVNTIMMTLWSVNDESTKEFVTSFFERLASNGWRKHEAFEYAKRTIRKKYREPYYWAPFVMLDGI